MIGEARVLAAWAIAVIGATAGVLVAEESGARNDPLVKARRGQVTGLHELSLARAQNTRFALNMVIESAQEGAVVTSLRLSPLQLNASMQNADHSLETIDVNVKLDPRVVRSGAGNSKGVAPARIDPAVPEKLLHELDERFGFPPERLNYMVFDPDGWDVYMHKDALDAHFAAAADGSGLKGFG